MASLPPLAGRRIGPLANGAGLVLVVVALIGGRHLPLFAGCLGAALLVWPKAAQGWAGAFLALRPLRFVGKIPYSLYLWHWPLLVLTREYLLFGERVPTWVLPAYLVGLVLLSIASWRFVERPFRDSGKGRRIAPLAGAVAGAVVVALAGSYVLLAQGLPTRFPAAAARYASFAAVPPPHGPPVARDICVVSRDTANAEELSGKCLTIDSTRPNVLLVGDSHEVVVLGPSPEYRDPLPLLLAYGTTRGPQYVKANEKNGAVAAAQARIGVILAGTAARYMTVLDIVCPDGVCRSTTPEDEPMLRDANHLSVSGAQYVAAELRRRSLFADLLATVPKNERPGKEVDSRRA